MMTSDLIDCLVGDRLPRTMRLTSRFWLALGLGVLAAAVLFMVGVGPRSDFAMAIHTLRFDLKFVETLALTSATVLLCFRLMRPDARIGTLGLGVFAAAVLFMVGVGPRSDFVMAIHTLRFDLKFVETLALASAAVLVCFRLMRPDARIGTLGLCLGAPFLLLGMAGVTELFLVPSAVWKAKMIGVNSLKCLTLTPLLSIPPLIAVIYAIREGATRHPALSGALAGASAAGIAATLYASNCTDDSHSSSRFGIRRRRS